MQFRTCQYETSNLYVYSAGKEKTLIFTFLRDRRPNQVHLERKRISRFDS